MTEGTTLATFLTSISGALSDFSVETLSTVLVAGLGIAIPLVIAWFGYRFVKRRANKALTKGSM